MACFHIYVYFYFVKLKKKTKISNKKLYISNCDCVFENGKKQTETLFSFHYVYIVIACSVDKQQIFHSWFPTQCFLMPGRLVRMKKKMIQQPSKYEWVVEKNIEKCLKVISVVCLFVHVEWVGVNAFFSVIGWTCFILKLNVDR